MNEETISFLKLEISRIPKTVINTFLSKDSTLNWISKYIKSNRNQINYYYVGSNPNFSTTTHIFEIGENLVISFNIVYDKTMSIISLKGLTKNLALNISGTRAKILVGQVIKYYKKEKEDFFKYYSVECINYKINQVLRYNNYNYKNNYINFESDDRTDRVNFIRHFGYNISQDHKNIKEIYQIYNKISKDLNPFLNIFVLNNLANLNQYIINQIEFYNFVDNHFL